MSAGTGCILPPDGIAEDAVFSSSAARLPASTTEYPAPCKAMLTARPIPLPAPVTTAIFWLVILIEMDCHPKMHHNRQLTAIDQCGKTFMIFEKK
jgi:hypothetical protein